MLNIGGRLLPLLYIADGEIIWRTGRPTVVHVTKHPRQVSRHATEELHKIKGKDFAALRSKTAINNAINLPLTYITLLNGFAEFSRIQCQRSETGYPKRNDLEFE